MQMSVHVPAPAGERWTLTSATPSPVGAGGVEADRATERRAGIGHARRRGRCCRRVRLATTLEVADPPASFCAVARKS